MRSRDISLENALVGRRPGCRVSTYASGQHIFAQGDCSDALFYIRRGSVKLTMVSTQGREAVLAFLGAGDFFGEECLGRHPRRIAAATTMTACSLVRIEASAAKRLFQECRSFGELFIAYLVSRSLRTAQDLADQLLYPSEQRLARTLFLLGQPAPGGDARTASPEINQATLASKVGTTRARVSYFMNKFRRLGFIDYGDGLRVHPSLLSLLDEHGDGAATLGPAAMTALPSHPTPPWRPSGRKATSRPRWTLA
jgi:CRP-like cAMP-binding protein